MLFLFHTRLRPYSTPLPYTTLFRSTDPPANGPRSRTSLDRTCTSCVDSPAFTLPSLPRSVSHTASRSPPHSRRLSHTDRKSTRLNSSHLVISYAVFCLKKKKKARDH